MALECQQDQKRTNSRRPTPRTGADNSEAVAEKSCGLDSVGCQAARRAGNSPSSAQRKGTKSRHGRFPGQQQPFAFAAGSSKKETKNRKQETAAEFKRSVLLSGSCRLLMFVLEVGFAPRTSRRGAIVTPHGRTGGCGAMRVAAARPTVAVALGRRHAGRAKQDGRYANQVKYFHRQSPKSTHRVRFRIRLPAIRTRG